jgi:hypothetical protein
LSKVFLYIAVIVIPFCGFGQERVKEKWKSEKDYLEYKKGEKYKGPTDWYGSSPASLKDKSFNPITIPSGGGGGQYSPQQIQRDRERRYQGFEQGGGSGELQHDPTVERPDPWESESTSAPDVDLPDVDAPSISPAVGQFLLFSLALVLLILIAYAIIKNRKEPNTKIIVEVEDDWNPEIVSKTELELRLEEAMGNDDYRECVRIYFTFILKELISKSWIFWRKEKTNYDYILEVSKTKNKHQFVECVRIYDLVWYGEYEIDKETYNLIYPTLENYYKFLEPKGE